MRSQNGTTPSRHRLDRGEGGDGAEAGSREKRNAEVLSRGEAATQDDKGVEVEARSGRDARAYNRPDAGATGAGLARLFAGGCWWGAVDADWLGDDGVLL